MHVREVSVRWPDGDQNRPEHEAIKIKKTNN